eukprot:6544657-Karenia_brevis.AAC.1
MDSAALVQISNKIHVRGGGLGGQDWVLPETKVVDDKTFFPLSPTDEGLVRYIVGGDGKAMKDNAFMRLMKSNRNKWSGE